MSISNTTVLFLAYVSRKLGILHTGVVNRLKNATVVPSVFHILINIVSILLLKNLSPSHSRV